MRSITHYYRKIPAAAKAKAVLIIIYFRLFLYLSFYGVEATT